MIKKPLLIGAILFLSAGSIYASGQPPKPPVNTSGVSAYQGAFNKAYAAQKKKKALQKERQDMLADVKKYKSLYADSETKIKQLRADSQRNKQEMEEQLRKSRQLNALLEKKAKEFYLKSRELEQMKEELESLKLLVNSLNNTRASLMKENQELKTRLEGLMTSKEGEWSAYYQELGTAYTQAQRFDSAIEAYLKSLKADPDNAKSHYNLGLLYKHSRNNGKKAAWHLKKYLQLEPGAQNRDEVEYLIQMLTE